MIRNGTSPSPHFIGAMQPCVPLCLCWPRPGEAPFSPPEQDFLAAGIDRNESTMDFMARMDALAKCVGADRMGYLLSVPCKFLLPSAAWVATSWLRVHASWTADEFAATLFVQKMVQFKACPALVYQGEDYFQPGWSPGHVHHPGRAVVGKQMRATALHEAASRRSTACYVILHDAIMQRARQAWRWERRKARVRWVCRLSKASLLLDKCSGQ